MKKKTFKFINKKTEADIYIYDDIGDGWFGGVSAKSFQESLAEVKNATQLNVFINSPGGSVFDGISIYNQLKRHNANVTVEIDGLAASIASLIAMSGDEIHMAENAMMMIHKPWGGAFGTADEMRAYADTLDQVEDTLVTTYTNRTGGDADTIKELMLAETWMDWEQALEYGFIDDVTAEKRMAAYVDLSKYNFKNVPDTLPSAVYSHKPEPRHERWTKYKHEIETRSDLLNSKFATRRR